MIWKHDFFRTEIALIQNEDIKRFTEWFLDSKMPLWFWESKASSSGKYHPEFTKTEGGLVKHCKAVAQMAYELSNNFSFGFPDDPLMRDYAVCASILHDCAKYGTGNEANHKYYSKHDLNGSILVSNSWEEFFHTSCPKEISDPILRHMGQWGTESPKTPIDLVVHLADYVTSRPMLDYPEIVRDYHEVYAELPFL